MKHLKVLWLLPFFFSWSCISFDKSEIDNLSKGEVTIIGHGGVGFPSYFPFNYFPSNSLASFSQAMNACGVEGIEVDVHMTADGQFVLYHDNDLQSKTEAEGCIEQLTYENVKGVNYRLGFPFDFFQSEKVIGLEELITFLKQQEEFPFVHFDIRSSSTCFTLEENEKWALEFCRKLLPFLQRHDLPIDKVFIISLSRPFLDEAIRLKYPYILSLEEVGTFEDGLSWVLERKLDYLTIKPRLLTAAYSAQAHENGIKIITFGGKSKSGNADLLHLNPDILQSNNPCAAKELLN